jgi:endonuclease/exonuclease/phosphatase family metal-dependent hydrolase
VLRQRDPLAIAHIAETETIVFGKRRVGEKGFLYAEIDVGGRVLPLVNLHLHFSSRRRRLQQLDLLVNWLRLKQRERGRLGPSRRSSAGTSTPRTPRTTRRRRS